VLYCPGRLLQQVVERGRRGHPNAHRAVGQT